MRRFWGWTLALGALIALAMVATLRSPLGFSLWHYNVALGACLLLGALCWRLLERRRVATLVMAFTGVLATASGFAMLYTKDFARKEWITWWHGATSFAFALAFLVHWVHNNARLTEFAKRLLTTERARGYTLASAWALVAVAGAWTWLAPAREGFTRENYLYLASWAILVGVASWYGIWLAYRVPAMRARLAVTSHRNRVRALVDASLFLANWGALLTGIALLYFAEPLRAGPLKYVSKWWHTAASVALLALLAIHIGFNARLLAAHARRVDDEIGLKNP